jgi:hypothetical protein
VPIFNQRHTTSGNYKRFHWLKNQATPAPQKMATSSSRHLLTKCLLLVALFPATNAQMQGSGRRQRDREASFVKDDLKPIACDTCELAMEKLFHAVQSKRAAAPLTTKSLKPGKKEKVSSFSEDDVNSVLLEVCHRYCILTL